VYLYSFNKFFWADKVCRIESNKKIKPWDLISVDGDFCINLGEKISFSEQYNYKINSNNKIEIIYKWLLSEKAINLIHWMVDTYYCTYKSLMKYFLPVGDVNSLLEREIKKSKIWKESDKSEKIWFKIAESGQTLIVFPDLWTLFNTIDEKSLNEKNVAFLSSTQTQNQKDKNWRDIKKWNKSIILSTYGEIFQDYYDLKKIIFIDPHKWYYANQQDPRYKVGDVLNKIEEIYEAELEIIGV